MLHSTKDLVGYGVGATDGAIGHVKDVYFDDGMWVVRYLVVDAGNWLSSRKVLISPIEIGDPDRKRRLLPASLTRQQVRNSPDVDTEKPVSRQHEFEYTAYYGYPDYWGDKDPHLRSCNAVMGYGIHASDGDIGHVQDMLVDDQTWAVRYLIVDTGNWWLGHKVLIAPQWIEYVSWYDGKFSVKLTRQVVKDAPEYDPLAILTRMQEVRLHEHYGRGGYWSRGEERDIEALRL